MKMRMRHLTFFLVALATALPLMGQSLTEVQERMRERLPAVDSLKLEAVVGENNQGYLEARAELDIDRARLVSEENADRRQLYQVAARRAGVTLAEVEVMRAKQIRERSPKGIWLQSAEGEWYQKS